MTEPTDDELTQLLTFHGGGKHGTVKGNAARDAVLARFAELRGTRDAVIEECAKQADLAGEAAKQNYGVAESVGAHIAARRIRALRTGVKP